MNKDEINKALAAHRVWSVDVTGESPMVAIYARIEDVEGQGTCLVFSDGARWRNPVVKDVHLPADGSVELRLPGWAGMAPVFLRPMTLDRAQGLGLPDVDGLDPSNEAHKVIFDSMFPA